MSRNSCHRDRDPALRVILSVLIFFLFIVGSGCSKKEPKYPEDHARFQRIVEAIKKLQTAYVKRDSSTIHELLLPLDNLTKWEAAVRQDFSTFSDIQLDLTIERILIDEEGISAFVSWDGTWKQTSEDPPYSARGHGTLLWSGTQVILLRGVEGALPFGISIKPDFPS